MRVSIRGYSMIKRQRSHTRKETEQRAYQPASSTSFGTRDNTSRRPPASCLVFQQRRLQTTRPYHRTIKPQTLRKEVNTYHPYVSSARTNCWKSRRLQSGKPSSIYASFSAISSSVSGSARPTTYELYGRRRDEECQPVSMNSCAACRSSSNFSGVSSGPCGSRGVATIPLSRWVHEMNNKIQ